jgi:hypothetical protein
VSILIPPQDIERLVGAVRHETLHLARAATAEQTVYVLHSHECKGLYVDLRDCPFSMALNNGIDQDVWDDSMDRVVAVSVEADRLVPEPFEESGS